MTKKRILTSLALIVVLGAVFVVSQMVWASDDSVNKQGGAEASQIDHAAHHPAATANPNETVSAKAESAGVQDMMKDGSMQDMMKMMDTAEGKRMMEQCQELLKQSAENKSTAQ